MQAQRQIHVTVEVKGGGLLTASKLTVRSRHRSTWRATCLSAVCWSSSSCTSRQSVDPHLLSHSPAGGSRTESEHAKSYMIVVIRHHSYHFSEVPVSVVGVLFGFVLMIMSGMGWGGAQSHMRHADNKASKLKVILRPCYNLTSHWKQSVIRYMQCHVLLYKIQIRVWLSMNVFTTANFPRTFVVFLYYSIFYFPVATLLTPHF